jgi:moderate conductance mechanosensitive channel
MDIIIAWVNEHAINVVIILAVSLAFYTLGTTLLASAVNHTIKSARQHSWHRKDLEKRQRTLVALFTNIWRVLIITIATLALFTNIFPGFSLAPLFASAGIIGVALGFGAQTMVKDFISGIFIISENQYRVGDIIEINDNTGTVERIGTRSTVIRDVDGNVHYFPNGMVQHVINKTMGYSMARFTIDVHPSTDIEKVIEIINKTGEKLASEEKWSNKILEAPSFVSVGEFTSNTVGLLVSGKTQPSDQWAVTAEMRRRLLRALEKNDITLG